MVNARESLRGMADLPWGKAFSAGTRSGLAQGQHIQADDAHFLFFLTIHTKMANIENKDEIRDQIAQQLSQTRFACSSLTRLSGGTANFVYRGTPATPDSIIIKHTKDYVASNQDFKLDAKRCVSSLSCHQELRTN